MQSAHVLFEWCAKILGSLLAAMLLAFAIHERASLFPLDQSLFLGLYLPLCILLLGSILGFFKMWIAAIFMILGSSMLLIGQSTSNLIELYFIDGIIYAAAAMCKCQVRD